MAQAEPKMVFFENRSAACLMHVSTGSTEKRRLQAGLGQILVSARAPEERAGKSMADPGQQRFCVHTCAGTVPLARGPFLRHSDHHRKDELEKHHPLLSLRLDAALAL